MREGLYAEPEANVVHRHSEIFQRWVPQQDAEDVEDVMAIVGQRVGVDDCVELDGEESEGNEEENL